MGDKPKILIVSNQYYPENLRINDLVFTHATSYFLVAMIGNQIAKGNNVTSALYLLDLWPDNVFLMYDIKSKIMKDFWVSIGNKIYQEVDMTLISSKGFRNSLFNYEVDTRKLFIGHNTQKKLTKINK